MLTVGLSWAHAHRNTDMEIPVDQIRTLLQHKTSKQAHLIASAVLQNSAAATGNDSGEVHAAWCIVAMSDISDLRPTPAVSHVAAVLLHQYAGYTSSKPVQRQVVLSDAC